MKVINKKASALIKEYRTKKGWSQLDLQRTIKPGCKSPMQISNIELLKAPVPVKMINAISLAISLPSSILIDAMVEDYRDSMMSELSPMGDKEHKVIIHEGKTPSGENKMLQ